MNLDTPVVVMSYQSSLAILAADEYTHAGGQDVRRPRQALFSRWQALFNGLGCRVEVNMSYCLVEFSRTNVAARAVAMLLACK